MGGGPPKGDWWERRWRTRNRREVDCELRLEGRTGTTTEGEVWRRTTTEGGGGGRGNHHPRGFSLHHPIEERGKTAPLEGGEGRQHQTKGEGEKQHHPKKEKANQHHPKGEGGQHLPKGGGRTTTSVNLSELNSKFLLEIFDCTEFHEISFHSCEWCCFPLPHLGGVTFKKSKVNLMKLNKKFYVRVSK